MVARMSPGFDAGTLFMQFAERPLTLYRYDVATGEPLLRRPPAPHPWSLFCRNGDTDVRVWRDLVGF